MLRQICRRYKTTFLNTGQRSIGQTAQDVSKAPLDISYQEVESTQRVMNLSAGNAAISIEVLKKFQDNFVRWNDKGISVAEMGYRTEWFHEV